jgi:glycosyltransferase involved in cell wall biosynthesis
MRIGINLLYLLPGQVGGTETYARGLLDGLAEASLDEQFTVFVNQESADWPLPHDARFRKVVCPVSASRRWRRYWYEQCKLPTLLSEHGVDLVHSLGYVAPLRAKCPSVVTIHDLNFRACGRQMPLTRRWTLAAFVRWSALHSQRVIAVSEFSRQQLLKAYHLSPNHVAMIHLAPLSRPSRMEDAPRELARLGICEPYVLAFGNPFPHKNIRRLLEAFALCGHVRHTHHKLVIVGRAPQDDSWQQAARQLGIQHRVVLTGALTDEALASVLSGAQALVSPSLYEGFGLPILEAMAAGVPVACSDRGSMPEIAGSSSLLFDPLSVQEMAGAIGALATLPQLRQYLIDKGLKNATRFSWRQTAEQTLGVYREVLDVPAGIRMAPLKRAA